MLTVTEYLENNPHLEVSVDDIEVMPDDVELLAAGFIEWDKDEAELWSDPWSVRYVFVTVENHSLVPEIFSNTSIERPVLIHMTGNDDCSYSAVFATKEDALQALKIIEANPVFATLKQYNFFFTN